MLLQPGPYSVFPTARSGSRLQDEVTADYGEGDLLFFPVYRGGDRFSALTEFFCCGLEFQRELPEGFFWNYPPPLRFPPPHYLVPTYASVGLSSPSFPRYLPFSPPVPTAEWLAISVSSLHSDPAGIKVTLVSHPLFVFFERIVA